MISIIDYGLGNVLAFRNVFHRLNRSAVVARTPDELAGATRLILPGVGSFDHAMSQFDASGMRGEVERLVCEERIPVLGVCVGMQMLAASSDEGVLPGLGWVEGKVRKFDAGRMPAGTHLPHMGWNDVVAAHPGGLFHGLEGEARFYFLHSYYFECADSANIEATTDYGIRFTCAVRKDNIVGVQFHPEKSHRFGAQLLTNFADM